jgi:hypothetical protein
MTSPSMPKITSVGTRIQNKPEQAEGHRRARQGTGQLGLTRLRLGEFLRPLVRRVGSWCWQCS